MATTTKLTSEELSMLGFDQNGRSTLGGNNNYNASAWDAMPRPRTTAAPRKSKPQQMSLHFGLDDNYNKPVAQDKAKELQSYVGRFACVRGVYGLIDEIHNDRLGFVEGSEDEWSCHIVPMNQVRICTPMEAEIARSSAEWYFLNECQSLHRRLAICGEDEREKLAKMYEDAFAWYAKVKK